MSRGLGTIVEAIGDKARTTTEPARFGVRPPRARPAITAPHLDEKLRLQAITLDPAIEQETPLHRLIAQAQRDRAVCFYNDLASDVDVGTVGVIQA